MTGPPTLVELADAAVDEAAKALGTIYEQYQSRVVANGSRGDQGRIGDLFDADALEAVLSRYTRARADPSIDSTFIASGDERLDGHDPDQQLARRLEAWLDDLVLSGGLAAQERRRIGLTLAPAADAAGEGRTMGDEQRRLIDRNEYLLRGWLGLAAELQRAIGIDPVSVQAAVNEIDTLRADLASETARREAAERAAERLRRAMDQAHLYLPPWKSYPGVERARSTLRAALADPARAAPG